MPETASAFVSVVFADFEDVPEYHFDFPIMFLTLLCFVILYEGVMLLLPGVQFYAGNCIGVQKGKDGVTYGPRMGMCLDPKITSIFR